MLDPWIIEEIRRREEERQRDSERVELPLPAPPKPRSPQENDLSWPPNEEGERGVVVIDF